MIFKPNFIWIEKDIALVTSLLIWNNEYIPTQVVILRSDIGQVTYIILYFKNNDNLIGKFFTIGDLRTDTANELEFHIAFKIKAVLDEITTSDMEVKSDFDVEADYEFSRIVNSIFMSDVAMELMMKEHPVFGFYSISPNIMKIQTILSDEKDDMLKVLLSKRR